MTKTIFKKVAVREPAKREISVIAANEGRAECDVFEDAMKLYKVVVYGKSKKSPTLKNIKPVSLSDVVAHQEA